MGRALLRRKGVQVVLIGQRGPHEEKLRRWLLAHGVGQRGIGHGEAGDRLRRLRRAGQLLDLLPAIDGDELGQRERARRVDGEHVILIKLARENHRLIGMLSGFQADALDAAKQGLGPNIEFQLIAGLTGYDLAARDLGVLEGA